MRSNSCLKVSKYNIIIVDKWINTSVKVLASCKNIYRRPNHWRIWELQDIYLHRYMKMFISICLSFITILPSFFCSQQLTDFHMTNIAYLLLIFKGK